VGGCQVLRMVQAVFPYQILYRSFENILIWLLFAVGHGPIRAVWQVVVRSRCYFTFQDRVLVRYCCFFDMFVTIPTSFCEGAQSCRESDSRGCCSTNLRSFFDHEMETVFRVCMPKPYSAGLLCSPVLCCCWAHPPPTPHPNLG
jgi:hypothetical protein